MRKFIEPAEAKAKAWYLKELNERLLGAYYAWCIDYSVFGINKLSRKEINELEFHINNYSLADHITKSVQHTLVRELENLLQSYQIDYIKEFFARSYIYDLWIIPNKDLWIPNGIIVEVKQGKQSKGPREGIKQLLHYLMIEDIPLGWLVMNNNRPYEKKVFADKVIHIFGNLEQLKNWLDTEAPKY